MKNPTSKVAHEWPNFFSVLPMAQNQPKSQFLFLKNCSPCDLYIMTYLSQIHDYVFLFFSAKECDVLHGECVQTYVPYLFLVIPLGK